ncbi:hypothetical protein FA13DRAFT_1621889, partial [Coprinellus micaceus]
YIFILDSLGSKHPRAVSVLKAYLLAEAQDKKCVDSIAQIQGKFVNVNGHPAVVFVTRNLPNVPGPHSAKQL